MKLPNLILLLVAFVFPSCQSIPKDKETAAARAGEMASYDRLSRVQQSISHETPSGVFEGLPHPQNESEVYAVESRRRDTFTNHGFMFYSPEYRSASMGSGARIVRLPGTFKRWSGPKFCGGFHPDLLIRYGRRSDSIDFHVCLGCGEAMIFTLMDTIHVDLSEAAARELGNWQRFKMTHRPKPRGILE